MTGAATGLYEGVVLEHAKRPRNRGQLPHATHGAAVDNPLCGDTVRVELELSDGRVQAAGFEGHACAIVTASASLMTEHVRGKTIAEVQALVDGMQTLCAGRSEEATTAGLRLGELAVFAGVRRYPARVRCATLPWHALGRALPE